MISVQQNPASPKTRILSQLFAPRSFLRTAAMQACRPVLSASCRQSGTGFAHGAPASRLKGNRAILFGGSFQHCPCLQKSPSINMLLSTTPFVILHFIQRFVCQPEVLIRKLTFIKKVNQTGCSIPHLPFCSYNKSPRATPNNGQANELPLSTAGRCRYNATLKTQAERPAEGSNPQKQGYST